MNTKSNLLGILILLLSVVISPVYSQKTQPKVPNFDVADFDKKFETARWLVEYDEVAWKTSDVVMTEDKTEIAKLGGEWFCIQDDKKLWHALYGKLADGKFQPVFHYTFDSASKVSRSSEKFNQKLLDGYAMAISTAQAKLKISIPAGSPRFNQYIRKEPNGTFGVWMLPAFQTNGVAVYGGEAYYSIDSAGSKILKEESSFKPEFLGFKASPPREIWLNFREQEKPSLGAIFFVWYYKPYFTKIYIDNARSTSSVIETEKGEFIWLHVEKDDAKTTKP